MTDQDLSRALQTYVDENRSGTLIATFSDHSLGRIYLFRGRPTFARYKTTEGDEALELTKQAALVKVKFHNNLDLVRSTVLLFGADPQAIKIRQEGAAPPEEQPDAVAAAASDAVAAAPDAPAEPNQSQDRVAGIRLTDAARNLLGELLIEELGPVATVVMADLPSDVGLDKALQIVTQDIDDTKQAAEFFATAKRIIMEVIANNANT